MINISKDFKALIINSSWSLFGTIISRALMFFAWVYIANHFGKVINGEIGMLRSTINLFISFVGTGFGLTLTRYIPKYLENTNNKVNKIISASFFYSSIMAFSFSVILYFTAPYILKTFFNRSNLLYSLRISSVLLFLSIINGVLFGFLQGFEKFKELSIVNIVNGISLFVFLIFFSRFNSIDGVFVGFTLSILLTSIISIFYVSKILKSNNIRLTMDFKSELSIFYAFTIPAILSGLMVVPFKWVLDTMLVNSKNGYMAMGLFTALFLFHTLLLMTVNTLNAPLITIMSKTDRDAKIDKLNILIPWSMGIVITTPFFIFPELLGALFGKSYIGDIHFTSTTILILITTVFVLFKNGLSRIMIVNNLMWLSFFSNLLWGIVLITTFYITGYKNAIGISLSYTLAYTINILIIIPIYLQKKIIPKTVLLSIESLGVWLFFGSLIFISINNTESIIIKFLTLFIYLTIFITLFYLMLNKNEKN